MPDKVRAEVIKEARLKKKRQECEQYMINYTRCLEKGSIQKIIVCDYYQIQLLQRYYPNHRFCTPEEITIHPRNPDLLYA